MQELAPKRGRGRRPAAEVRQDVYSAVGPILLNEGMGQLSFERVAREAGVSKTTLYRWWPSLGVLILDCYVHAVENELAFNDSGDIKADLTSQLTAFTRVMTKTRGGRVLTELIGAAQTDPELAAEYRRLYSSVRRQAAVKRLAKAREDGQIREEANLESMVDQLWGAVYHRVLIPDLPVTQTFIDALVGNLLSGTAHSRNPDHLS